MLQVMIDDYQVLQVNVQNQDDASLLMERKLQLHTSIQTSSYSSR